MAKIGQAMRDGSFPIANEADLKAAIRLVGNASDPAAAKRHIIHRARGMQMKHTLPLSWL